MQNEHRPSYCEQLVFGNNNVSIHLVRSLIELLGVERGTQAERETRSEKDVVCYSGDTAVIDLGL